MAKTFELMEEHMPVRNGNQAVTGGVSSRLAELGTALPAPPTPLGAPRIVDALFQIEPLPDSIPK
jgi:hypothetical protein